MAKLKDTYVKKVGFSKGGNSSENAKPTGRVTIPGAILEMLGIDEDNNEVVMIVDEKTESIKIVKK